MKPHILSKHCIYFWMLFILAGCTRTTQAPVVSPTRTEAVSTITPSMPPTLSMTPAPTETVTVTPLPVTPTSSLTPTLLPPLPVEQAQRLAVALLDDNAGCRLPCWWGITPGQTSWQAALEFFSQFSIDIAEHPQGLVAEVWPPITINESSGWYLDLFLVKRDDVYYIEVYPLQKWHKYHLSQLLTEYGKPDEVWMHTSRTPGPPSGGSGPGSFTILYLYYRQGIVASFGSPVEGVGTSDVFLRGCFNDGPDSLFLWPPQAYQSFLDFAKEVDLDELKYAEKLLLPLDAATDMDIDTFYQTYSNSEFAPCIDTLENLWPEP